MYEACEISRTEVLDEIQKTPAYFGRPASREWLLARYRQQRAASAKTAEPAHEVAFYLNDLVQDLQIEGVTPAQFDFCLREWRKGENEFLPKIAGPFLKILNEAGFSKPMASSGERHINRLRALVDPNYVAKPTPQHRGIRTKPPQDTAPPMSPDERKAHVERLNALRPVMKSVTPPAKRFAELKDKRARELALVANRVAVRAVAGASDCREPSYFEVVVRLDDKGSDWIRVNEFIREADARAWVDDIAKAKSDMEKTA